MRWLRIWVKKYVFPNRSYGNFANFLIALALIKRQIVFISGVEYDTLRVFVFSTPIVNRLQQLLSVLLALKLWMNTQQRQYMYSVAR